MPSSYQTYFQIMSRNLPNMSSPLHSSDSASKAVAKIALKRYRLLSAAALLLVLAGCSNNPYPAGDTAKPVLYRVLTDDLKTLDPSISYTVDEGVVIDTIYPTYYQYHYLKRDPFVMELSLGAEEAKRETIPVSVIEKGKPVTKQGERWTFRLKPNLRFQDDPCFPGGKGRNIKAADVLYSFRRMGDPAIACPVLSFFGEKVLGMAEYSAHLDEVEKQKQQPDYNAPIEGLQLDPNDPYTFRIVLNQPYPQLRYLMAMHFTTPLAHEAVEMYGKDLARHPVGCGAFKLAELSPKQRIVLVKNDNYREDYYPTEGAPGDREAGLLEDAGKRLPLVDKVQYNIIREGVTSWNLFQQGYEDQAAVTQTNFQQVISSSNKLSPEMSSRGIQLLKTAAANVYYYGFNMNDPVVGGYTPEHRKLRQAISMAIDSQADIDLFHQGLGIPAQFIIAKGINGYDPNYVNPYREHNVEKAKQLLTEAGYPGGIDSKTGERLTIYYENAGVTAAGRQSVALCVKNLDDIGIHVESRVSLPNIWQGKIDKGEYQFMRYGWFADYPDPENFVFLLYGPNKRPGPNASNYANPEYDKLFEQMQAMNDGPERLAIIAKMRTIAVEDCPWIYINHDEALTLSQSWLHNVKPHPVSNESAKYLRVDAPLRDKRQHEWNHPNYVPAILFFMLLIFGSAPAASVINKRRNRHVRRSSGGVE